MKNKSNHTQVANEGGHRRRFPRVAWPQLRRRERMSREGNPGWERDRTRGKAIERHREASGVKLKGQEERNENEAVRGKQPYQRPNSASYAVVVARNNWISGQRKAQNNEPHSRESSSSTVHLDIAPDEKKWLSEAWVGQLKNLVSFERIKDDLLWDIGVYITPKYMGDDLVLLLGLTDAKAEQMLNEENDGGVSMFHSLDKWSPSLRTGFKLTWVQCWGILIMTWDMKQTHKIVAAIGDMVEVDDDVEEGRRMDRARVLIKTQWRPAIQHMVNVHIGREVHKVHVVEECGFGTHDSHYRLRSAMVSSEEIESVESDFGTMIQGHANAWEKEIELQDMEEPETRVEPRRTTLSPNTGNNSHGTSILPSSQSDKENP
ncbi:hypothetical protein HKD37_18G050012 [Glycine soja]